MAKNKTLNPDWYLFSRDSSHLTYSLDNLSQPIHYHGPENITTSDDLSIPIAYSGANILPTPYRKFFLSLLLHIPNFSHNLFSISNLTQDNNIYISFDTNDFVIKDLKTHQVLLLRPSHKGLYLIQSARQPSHNTALSSICQASSLWHNWLGHPRHQVLHIPTFSFVCFAFKVSKVHKLYFS